MKTPARFMTIVVLVAGTFIAGYMASRHIGPATSSAASEQAPVYACPMHPQYRSDHPMDCPICGMRLEPLASGGEGAASGTHGSEEPGTVRIGSAKRQLIGVRTDEVRRSSASQVLRVPGRVTVDDQRLYRVIAATDGWILELGPNTVGRSVRRGQLLATYYTRDLLASEQLFLVSVSDSNPAQRGSASYGSLKTGTSLIPQYPVDSLRNLGMSDRQIADVEKARIPAPDIKIYSPVTGYVLARNVSPEQRFDKGTEFYRIGDISRVWVLTDIFEKDREFLTPGTKATVLYQGRKLEASMSDALPQFDSESRILQTRFELDNPGQVLLPDMFVDVELEIERRDAVTVPADAVIDSGRRKTVYLEREAGVFEPRLVETGWRLGDRVEVTRGLEPGERIVVSGNFLIDSESRMRMPAGQTAAASAKAGTVKDPVCGMDVDPNSDRTLKTRYQGKTYYFCSEMCRKNFEANPAKYLPKKEARGQVATAKDPVCGMDVDPASDRTLKTEYQGKTYYFCAEMCRERFEADPEKYVHAMAEGDMHGMHTHE
jgi:Cu(I)/Ag(I) efflux system membrane fusion protein